MSDKLVNALAGGLPPLDEEQLATRDKLLGNRWMEGDKKDETSPHWAELRRLRVPYSLYDSAQRLGNTPQFLPLASPWAMPFLTSELVQRWMRNQLDGPGRPKKDSGDY